MPYISFPHHITHALRKHFAQDEKKLKTKKNNKIKSQSFNQIIRKKIKNKKKNPTHKLLIFVFQNFGLLQVYSQCLSTIKSLALLIVIIVSKYLLQQNYSIVMETQTIESIISRIEYIVQYKWAMAIESQVKDDGLGVEQNAQMKKLIKKMKEIQRIFMIKTMTNICGINLPVL